MIYPDGHSKQHEVLDKLEFYHLLYEIDNNYSRLLKWDVVEEIWNEVKT